MKCFFACLLLGATLALAQNSVQTCSDVRVLQGSYDYDSDTNGPLMWAALDESYKACGNGKMQSPFNLQVQFGNRSNKTSPPKIRIGQSLFKYGGSPNNFFLDCVKKYSSCGTITYKGKSYSLVQTHLHSPSEYLVNGVAYPLEAHFVHKNDKDGSLAVLGVFFDIGDHNPEFQKMLDAARSKDYRMVHLQRLISPQDSSICTFEGSLTTPPCTEGVQWILSLGVARASLEQIGMYRTMVGQKKTNRPLQEANGRMIKCYRPESGAKEFPSMF